MKTAVFIDTMSIQKYIFSSNSLKENIGASFLLKQLFEELKEAFSDKKDFSYSYIGGGNALLYFKDKETAQEEMKKWSKNILVKYPGITPIIVIDNDFDEKNYAKSRTKIIRKSFKQKNESIPITTLSSFGFTTECPRTGLTSEIYLDKNVHRDDFNYISSQSYSKVIAAKDANDELEKKFRRSLNGKKFPDELDNLGGSKGENNHIAVVHIDGNDMGEIFKKKANENDLIAFSKDLGNATEDSFGKLVEKVIEDIKEISEELNLKNEFLPLRPIIIGGDDITFVCDARLALYLAYNFIKTFENQEICKTNEVTACAGISIVKTKYPFYRAYKMAEELCGNAKKERKNNIDYTDADSLIDFHISFGGLGNSLTKIRETNYASFDRKQLYAKPYSIKEIPKFIKGIYDLSYNKMTKLPQGKIKKLREVLNEGETATTKFINELKYRNKKLPQFSHSNETEKGFTNSKTPYLDMIEMIDFCPKFFVEFFVEQEAKKQKVKKQEAKNE